MISWDEVGAKRPPSRGVSKCKLEAKTRLNSSRTRSSWMSRFWRERMHLLIVDFTHQSHNFTKNDLNNLIRMNSTPFISHMMARKRSRPKKAASARTEQQSPPPSDHHERQQCVSHHLSTITEGSYENDQSTSYRSRREGCNVQSSGGVELTVGKQLTRD